MQLLSTLCFLMHIRYCYINFIKFIYIYFIHG